MLLTNSKILRLGVANVSIVSAKPKKVQLFVHPVLSIEVVVQIKLSFRWFFEISQLL